MERRRVTRDCFAGTRVAGTRVAGSSSEGVCGVEVGMDEEGGGGKEYEVK